MRYRDYDEALAHHEELTEKKNRVDSILSTSLLTRYEDPVLTKDHVPPIWRYDLDPRTNPFFLERMPVNAVFNAGAIYHEGHHVLVARIEGSDRKSFFGIARSRSGTEGFVFDPNPLVWDDIEKDETNMYDMRLVAHEDGWIYGIFCSESKDPDALDHETDKAVAAAGLVRTKDLLTFERLPNIITSSRQQRNVVLHPEFIDGKYAFYTRPQDGFIESGKGGGIALGLCDDITRCEINHERVIFGKAYHTVYESKNGQGPAPIRTEKGFIHIAHGVRVTASGLRYVLYAFATSLDDPFEVIARPGGYLLAPEDEERIGDVSNVVFTNGITIDPKGIVHIYYGSSDTRLHVATTPLERLIDYVFNAPKDSGRSIQAVQQRRALIDSNRRIMYKKGWEQ
jgi:4-O-beta-D-mannosyl-D-glucose phosphorylase